MWVECLNHEAVSTDDSGTAKKKILLRNDVCMMTCIDQLQYEVLKLLGHNCVDLFTLASQFISHFVMHHTTYRTYLAYFAIRIIYNQASILLTYIPFHSVKNKTLYGSYRPLQSNVCGIDISSTRLWYAMLITKCGDYHFYLRFVNKVLSSISPFALYFTGGTLRHVSDGTKKRYVDMFSSNDTRVTERARRAWMIDLRVMPSYMGMVPAAIQVEIVHCEENYSMSLSPFVCAYYLMFLNYCGLR